MLPSTSAGSVFVSVAQMGEQGPCRGKEARANRTADQKLTAQNRVRKGLNSTARSANRPRKLPLRHPPRSFPPRTTTANLESPGGETRPFSPSRISNPRRRKEESNVDESFAFFLASRSCRVRANRPVDWNMRWRGSLRDRSSRPRRRGSRRAGKSRVTMSSSLSGMGCGVTTLL
jgi:hypothetical protein